MNLESPNVTVQKSAQYVFEVLSDVKNFENLMPENISKFEVIDEDTFIFGLKGMPEIKLKINEKVHHTCLILAAASDNFPFTLKITITAISDQSSQVQLFFEGEFNAMMSMMIKVPISKFIESLSENMNKL